MAAAAGQNPSKTHRRGVFLTVMRAIMTESERYEPEMCQEEGAAEGSRCARCVCSILRLALVEFDER